MGSRDPPNPHTCWLTNYFLKITTALFHRHHARHSTEPKPHLHPCWQDFSPIHYFFDLLKHSWDWHSEVFWAGTPKFGFHMAAFLTWIIFICPSFHSNNNNVPKKCLVKHLSYLLKMILNMSPHLSALAIFSNFTIL